MDGSLPFDEEVDLFPIWQEGKSLLVGFARKSLRQTGLQQVLRRLRSDFAGQRIFGFSASTMSYVNWEKERSKRSVVDSLKLELDNKSSVTMHVTPPFLYDAEDEFDVGHVLTVIDCDVERGAVKLYDPNCKAKNCISSKALPPSFEADPSEGERWITVDQMEKRNIEMTALHAKDMCKFSYQSKIKLKPIDPEKYTFAVSCVYNVEVKQSTSLIVNLISYEYALLESVKAKVAVAEEKETKTEIDHELPHTILFSNTHEDNDGELAQLYCQRFKLQPNTYTVSIELDFIEEAKKYLKCYEEFREATYFLLKMSSVAECTFEQANCERVLYF